MTTTLLRPDATRTPTTDVLRVLLDEVLSEVADDATDRYSSRTPAGRALLSLAALARRAAGALGADAGVALTSGPGVVVQRELAAATHLLDQAVGAAGGESPEVAEFVVPAQRLHAHLLQALAATDR
ncbi:hypothetical protein [Blastococcus haudaquaticus]|uniref:Uncharacterized protein n=1 Tax=Blastococcus haudaquaticus TaxID=1938745 RepID=A0A286H0X3_9ACTN|nr:hypothetical protein [Blastococcus haudaquaticus]SOE01423.1 hypothetical protein SAMN06272739_3154 [Blastococcus haudaquaticus]